MFGSHTTTVDRLRGLASQLPILLIVISLVRKLKRIDGYDYFVVARLVSAARGEAERTSNTAMRTVQM